MADESGEEEGSNERIEISREAKQEIDEAVEERVKERMEEITGGSSGEEYSRRSFLKKVGLGVAGLGAASLVPGASAYDIRSSDGLSVYSNGTKTLDASTADVKIPNGDLDLKGNNLVEVGGTTDASSGAIRLANNSSILARNSGDTGDFGITFGSSDKVETDAELQMNAKTLTLGDSNGSGILMQDTGASPASNYRMVNGAGNLAIRENGNDRMAFISGGPIQIKNVDLNMTGNAIKDTTGSLTLQSSKKNIEIPTTNKIVDQNANRRIRLAGTNTSLFDDADQNSLFLDSSLTRISIQSGKTFDIFDGPQNAKGIEYTPSSNGPGTLELTNATLDIAGDTRTIISNFDSTNNHWIKGPSGSEPGNLALGFNWDSANNEFNLVTLGNAANLRLATGKAIEDGNGTGRFEINANTTRVNDETGTVALSANGTNWTKFFTSSGRPLIVTDNEQGGSDGLRYEAGSPSGTLELTNADLNVKGDKIRYTGPNSNFIINSATTYAYSAFAKVRDVGLRLSTNNNSASVALDPNGAIELEAHPGGPVELRNSDLRLATGQAIEDGGGTNRFEVLSGNTLVNYDDGTRGIELDQGQGRLWLYTTSSSDFAIRDTVGSFNAVTYTPSSSAPGTLELTNANLDLKGNEIVDNGTGVVKDRKVFRFGSASGTEVAKIGEFRNRNARFEIKVIGATDQGRNEVRHLAVHGWKRGNNIGGFYNEFGGPNSEEVNIVMTETSNDADGDGHNDAYLYAVADDFANCKIVIEMYEDVDFTPDFTQGLATSNITGTQAFDTRSQSPTSIFHSSGRFEVPNGDLRLATGQSIQKGNGVPYFELNNFGPIIYDGDGNVAAQFGPGGGHEIHANTQHDLTFHDDEGGFVWGRYFTSSSAPGTLELTNANLDLSTNQIYSQPGSSGGSTTVIEMESNVNAGSDFGRIKQYDDYPSFSNTSGEGFALVLETVNDGTGGAGPDAVVAESSSGFYVADSSQTLRLHANTAGDLTIEGSFTEGASLDLAENIRVKEEQRDSVKVGDVVGIEDGEVTRETSDAAVNMVASAAPGITLGGESLNLSEEEKEKFRNDYRAIAFTGQVPVKVRGTASEGDYLLPSGYNDGTAVAIPEYEISFDQYRDSIGVVLKEFEVPGNVNEQTAEKYEELLEEAEGKDYDIYNVAVGVK